MRRLTNKRLGLTLIELVIVILIIGVLAAIAAPKFHGMSGNAANTTTITQLRSIVVAAERFVVDEGRWPQDMIPGRIPPGLVPYLSYGAFSKEVPIGGKYDWDRDAAGLGPAAKVTHPNPDLNVWDDIDREFDDGERATGQIRIRLFDGNWHLIYLAT